MPRWLGRRRVPAASASPPSRKSSPRRRTNDPGATFARTITASPSRAVSSCATTASAPSGSAAPVKMRIADPAASGPGRAPACDSPRTGSR